MRKLCVAILLLAAPGLSQAQTYINSGGKAKTWEWSFALLYQDSEHSGGDGGSNLKIDSAFGLGLNFNYNLSDRLALGMDFEWLTPDYKATLINDANPADNRVIDHSFDQFNGRLKGTYSFMDGPVTPYVEAGLGWTYFDSNVADGPPITGCWWHPYWGYICDGYYNTYTETAFSYGGAIGVRYALKNGTLVKLSYNTYWLDNVGAASDPTLSALRLEFGWRF
jgi:opacity protein-like surface antigen